MQERMVLCEFDFCSLGQADRDPPSTLGSEFFTSFAWLGSKEGGGWRKTVVAAWMISAGGFQQKSVKLMMFSAVRCLRDIVEGLSIDYWRVHVSTGLRYFPCGISMSKQAAWFCSICNLFCSLSAHCQYSCCHLQTIWNNIPWDHSEAGVWGWVLEGWAWLPSVKPDPLWDGW